MTRAPAALATLVLVSNVGTPGAEPCAPRAQLEGDRAAVERVAGELRELGVSIAPATAGCPSVRAVVELDLGGGIAVAVRGSSPGSEGRLMSDAAIAAAWIDSWARDDLEVASWGAPVTGATVTASFTPPVRAPRDVPPATSQVETPLIERLAISGSYEQSWTGDGSAWSGGSASGCLLVGGFCVGARARAAFEPTLSSGLTDVARNDLSVFATGSFPIDVGQMTLAPELGVGIGRFATRRLDGCKLEMTPDCNPMDPNCLKPPAPCGDSNGVSDLGNVYVGGQSESSYAPRIALAVRVAIPLLKYVWLDGLASVTLSPLAHTDLYPSSMESPNLPPSAELALPGEPRTGLQLGIGLRVGAP